MMGGEAEGSMARGIRSAMIGSVVAGALVLVVSAVAQEPPAFRKGLWEFARTVEGTGQPKNTVTRKVCTSPTEDMRRVLEQSVNTGCQLSETHRSGNTFRYTATCVLQNGKITSKQILTAQADSAYTVKIESEGVIGGHAAKTTEELVAKRLGDCQ